MDNKKIKNTEAKELFKSLALDSSQLNTDSSEIEILTLMKKFHLYLTTQNGIEGIGVGGKKPTTTEIKMLKKHKPAIMTKLQKKENVVKAKKQAEKIKKENYTKIIKNNKQKIVCNLYEGEILQSYITGLIETELLESIGMAKYINGWGTRVNRKLIEALGTEFTWSQVLAFTAPIIKAEEKEKEKEKEKEIRIEEKAFKKALKTGKPQKLNSYMDECNNNNEECNIDIITTYAMPNGKTKTVRQHTW